MDEFFGRIGREIARELADNNKHSKLFNNKSENWINFGPEEKKKLKDLVKEYETVERSPKSVQKIGEKLDSFLSKFQKTLRESWAKQQAEEISYDDFQHEIINANKQFTSMIYGDDFSKHLGNVFISYRVELSILLIKRLLQEIRTMTECQMVEIKQSYQGIVDESAIALKNDCVETINKIINEDMSDIIKSKRKYEYFGTIIRDDEIKNNVFHTLGYVAAEYYMKNNPDWLEEQKKLIGESNKNIFEKYINTDLVKEWAEEKEIFNFIKRNI